MSKHHSEHRAKPGHDAPAAADDRHHGAVGAGEHLELKKATLSSSPGFSPVGIWMVVAVLFAGLLFLALQMSKDEVSGRATIERQQSGLEATNAVLQAAINSQQELIDALVRSEGAQAGLNTSMFKSVTNLQWRLDAMGERMDGDGERQGLMNLRLDEGIAAVRCELTNAVRRIDQDMDENYSRSEDHLAALAGKFVRKPLTRIKANRH